MVDGELPNPKVPIIPGHEIVGRIDAIGTGVEGLRVGERIGVPWLGHTCAPPSDSTRELKPNRFSHRHWTKVGRGSLGRPGIHKVADSFYAVTAMTRHSDLSWL